jgi:mannose-6-phosphate isomerase-like protein (cupin superfamily)
MSDRVGGAVWIAQEILADGAQASVAKLRWDSRALDLPTHVHDHSDRFIIVLDGRGFFHVTDETAERFTGQKVRSVPARSRDVFLFSRGTVHTFSTDAEPMTLLSCELPYLTFNDPDQYRLPEVRWMAEDHRDSYQPVVGCDPAWSVLATTGAGESKSNAPLIATGLNHPWWWAAHAPH